MALPKNAVAFPEIKSAPSIHGMPTVALLFEPQDFAAMHEELGPDWMDGIVSRLDDGDTAFIETALRIGGKKITPRPFMTTDFPGGSIMMNRAAAFKEIQLRNVNDILDRAGKDITARPITMEEAGDIPAETVVMRILDALFMAAVGKKFKDYALALKESGEALDADDCVSAGAAP